MRNLSRSRPVFGGLIGIFLACQIAAAKNFSIPAGDLSAALDAYTAQTGIGLIVSSAAVSGIRTKGVNGEISASAALSEILAGTGFVERREGSAIAIIRNTMRGADNLGVEEIAAASTPVATSSALETVTVTSSKIGGDVQNIPISITALSQEQLTATQTAGGPDLIKQVPNMTFTKTNFSGYSIQLRGIGTQAISVATDPAVAVAFNDIPFIRNHFFEQEFYDVNQVEVLRGPQGTLYGRNATAGVVNLISAKPTDQFEAMASLEIGNYGERRPEAMLNIPLVDDRFDVRVAGEWTKRQGYSFNQLTGNRIDGRDLWSGRLSIGFKPFAELQTNLVWEHFSESDDRMRSSKQLCKTAPTPSEVGGVPVGSDPIPAYSETLYLSQGCELTSLYSPDAFQVPNGLSLPYYSPLINKGTPVVVGDPYASAVQSHNLRVIESTLDPTYRAKNDVVEFNADYSVTPALTATSQTGFSRDFLWSTEDYNRFNTKPGAFAYQVPSDAYANQNELGQLSPDPNLPGAGIFCDPQLGCSDRLVAEDLSNEHSWQLSQEFRLSSNFTGPFNFSVGGNYLHYETEENYYVFINVLTLAVYGWWKGTGGQPYQTLPWDPGVSDNSNCIVGGLVNTNPHVPTQIGPGGGHSTECMYLDPHPISNLNNKGHNYFLSQNPYTLNSYAGFGEAYYNVLSDLKLTAGLRWTDDQKHFLDIPSEVLVHGYGYPTTAIIDQQWGEFTGRLAVNWTPKLAFTDQTLVYASFSHGYKAGGANPPGAILLAFNYTGTINPLHPLTFKPEFIDAYELGSKNTLLDGALTLNGDVFFYNYQDYQISRIVDRTAINDNFNATVKGAELEATYEPLPGLRFNFAGGYEDSRIGDGQSSVDLMDRADVAEHPDWMVIKPFPTQASNCVLPIDVVARLGGGDPSHGVPGACYNAYTLGLDPVTVASYVANPSAFPGYAGFDPAAAPNNGQGFAKNVGGNKLPNAPPFTVSFGTQYTLPLSQDWAGTLRGDYYWQDYSWARVFNDNPYDRLRGDTNINLALIFTNQNGWQVMFYDKNVFNTTAITGDFLNSDDSALTTNIFLTDPKLIGVRVTKNW